MAKYFRSLKMLFFTYEIFNDKVEPLLWFFEMFQLRKQKLKLAEKEAFLGPGRISIMYLFAENR